MLAGSLEEWGLMNRLSTKDLLCTAAGFALSWYFFPPGFIALFFAGSGHVVEHLVWTAALLLCLAGLTALAIARRQQVERGLSDHRLGSAAGIAASSIAGYALLYAAPALPAPLSIAAFSASALLVSGGYAALVLAWACTLVRVDPRQAVASVLGAMLLYAVLSLAGLGTAQSGAVANVAVPCVSSALWLAVRVGPAGHAPQRSPLSSLRSLPWVQIGLIALFLFGGRIIIGLFFDYSLESRQTELLIRDALIGFVVAFLLVRLRHAPDPLRHIHASWMPVALVFLFGALLQLALGSRADVLGCGVVNAMLCCFECIVYLMLVQFAQEKQASPVLVFGFWLIALKTLPIFIQRCPTAILSNQLNLSGVTLALSVAFVVMAIIAGMLAFSNRRDGQGAERAGSDTPAGISPARAAFDSLCAEAGLTPREREIVALVVQGNSQKKIAELLGLSYSTVQSYAKGIYPKLGIHSKQELVDLFAGASMERPPLSAPAGGENR